MIHGKSLNGVTTFKLLRPVSTLQLLQSLFLWVLSILKRLLYNLIHVTCICSLNSVSTIYWLSSSSWFNTHLGDFLSERRFLRFYNLRCHSWVILVIIINSLHEMRSWNLSFDRSRISLLYGERADFAKVRLSDWILYSLSKTFILDIIVLTGTLICWHRVLRIIFGL